MNILTFDWSRSCGRGLNRTYVRWYLLPCPSYHLPDCTYVVHWCLSAWISWHLTQLRKRFKQNVCTLVFVALPPLSPHRLYVHWAAVKKEKSANVRHISTLISAKPPPQMWGHETTVHWLWPSSSQAKPPPHRLDIFTLGCGEKEKCANVKPRDYC